MICVVYTTQTLLLAHICSLRLAAELLQEQSSAFQDVMYQRQFYVLVQCAWCGVFMHQKKVAELPPALISHSICANCYDRMLNGESSR